MNRMMHSVLRNSFYSHIFRILLSGNLDGLGVLEQLRELALLALELRVAADVLLADEDVGNGTLLGHLLEGILDGGAVVCGR